MHLKRWITGIIALPFLVFFIIKGGAYFAVLVGVVCLLSMWEYYSIVSDTNPKAVSVIMIVGVFFGILIIFAAFRGSFNLILLIIALNLVICSLISIWQYKTNPNILETIKKQVQGMIYLPLLLSFLILIRNQADGMIWIFFTLAVIFAGDTSAYYFGSYLGRHKLCPSVSPGKTIEGSLGGLAANLVVGSVVKIFFLPALPWVQGLFLFVAMGIAGQAGDLFESMLKRSSNIKDSGSLLPGHGGFLDRIDALLFAAPVVYLFIVLFI
ncbi:MAG: phosphatidate cytidylyltransferase [Deltaproteobacteria bacterium]|nr:phosphatidate cytidylyltransferase [Deltaproteobacteria bacterium]